MGQLKFEFIVVCKHVHSVSGVSGSICNHVYLYVVDCIANNKLIMYCPQEGKTPIYTRMSNESFHQRIPVRLCFNPELTTVFPPSLAPWLNWLRSEGYHRSFIKCLEAIQSVARLNLGLKLSIALWCHVCVRQEWESRTHTGNLPAGQSIEDGYSQSPVGYPEL